MQYSPTPNVAASAPITDAMLRQALAAELPRSTGKGSEIVSLARRPFIYQSSFALERLDVGLSDGSALRLIFKNLSLRETAPAVQRAKPDFIYDPRREIEVYRQFTGLHTLGAAKLYASSVDPRHERYWLFLECVDGSELYQVGDFAVWVQVARWLARFHESFTGQLETVAKAAPLIRYDADFYRSWMQRMRQFLSRAADASVMTAINMLAARHEALIQHLLAQPQVLLHGEFYASNILVRQRVNSLRVCPIDWEMAAVGPRLVDLAALVSGQWSERQRDALALAYYEAMAPQNRPLEWREFMRDLDCCRLHLAIQWCGWFGRRQPISAHAHDWLSEAVELATRLDL
jgi:aminoglycoside phosphotransferase (APT) family kinase protein